MKYNTFIFMSDIKEKDPDKILVSFLERELSSLIVEILPDSGPQKFKTFLKVLHENKINFDCFIAGFDLSFSDNRLKKFTEMIEYAKTCGMDRLWLRINEVPEPQNLEETVKLLYSPIIGQRPLVILSQIPYFFRPGTLTHRMVSTINATDVFLSPIVKVGMRSGETDFAKKGLGLLKQTWQLLPTIYFPLNLESIAPEENQFILTNIVPVTKELSFLGWRSISNPFFIKYFDDLKERLMTKKEKVVQTKRTGSKKKATESYTKAVVISKYLAKRKSPTLQTESFGNLKMGDVIEIKRIIHDGEDLSFIETTEGYYVVFQKSGKNHIEIK